MKDLLQSFNLLDAQDKVSLTNCIVVLFVLLTAFKTLFSGLTITLSFAEWKIEALDFNSTLPLLFSLLNYGHKRMEYTKVILNEKEETKQ